MVFNTWFGYFEHVDDLAVTYVSDVITINKSTRTNSSDLKVNKKNFFFKKEIISDHDAQKWFKDFNGHDLSPEIKSRREWS